MVKARALLSQPPSLAKLRMDWRTIYAKDTQNSLTLPPPDTWKRDVIDVVSEDFYTKSFWLKRLLEETVTSPAGLVLAVKCAFFQYQEEVQQLFSLSPENQKIFDTNAKFLQNVLLLKLYNSCEKPPASAPSWWGGDRTGFPGRNSNGKNETFPLAPVSTPRAAEAAEQAPSKNTLANWLCQEPE